MTAVKTDCHMPARTDVDPAAIGRARLVNLMGDDLDFASWAAREAKSRGTLVSLDMEASTTSRGFAALAQLLPDVDIAFVNEVGLRQGFEGFGEDPHEGARELLAAGSSVVAVTMGSKGAFVASANRVARIPAFRVPVVDTTGAGDCFNGAFVVGYLNGWDVEACGRFASAAAALTVGAVGARTTLPDRAMVESSLSDSRTNQILG